MATYQKEYQPMNDWVYYTYLICLTIIIIVWTIVSFKENHLLITDPTAIFLSGPFLIPALLLDLTYLLISLDKIEKNKYIDISIKTSLLLFVLMIIYEIVISIIAMNLTFYSIYSMYTFLYTLVILIITTLLLILGLIKNKNYKMLGVLILSIIIPIILLILYLYILSGSF